MRVHRSAPGRGFTQLPNAMLQYQYLSYTARGLLAYLLSRPDGWQEDGRDMADNSPQGRGAVYKALRELTAAGFYRVEKTRMPDGTIVSEAHVHDTPQLVPRPSTPRPGTGGADGGAPGVLKTKKREKEPSLPPDDGDAPDDGGKADAPSDGPPDAPPDERTRKAVAALFRVIKPEPRLRLGEAETRALAPLVAEWLDRGATHADLVYALLPGLPARMYSPAALLRDRLRRKLPAPRSAEPAPPAECGECRAPVPRPGICRPCAGLGEVPRPVSRSVEVALAGAARVRAAMRGATPPVGWAV